MTTKDGVDNPPTASPVLADGCVLVLRTCTADMRPTGSSANPDFVWPESGPVECPDWSPVAECGRGLHGLLWARGDFSHLARKPGTRHLVVRVAAADIVDLGGKVKFPRGVVELVTERWWEAVAYIDGQRPIVVAIDRTATGDYGHAAATGDSGHAAALGRYGHAAATGDYGHAAATGDYGHAAATGYSGHAAATGDYGHAAATGDSGHAAATGYSGHAAATGYSGHAAALGRYGHAAATGDYGHAAATGYSGHAAALGRNGRVKAGPNGLVAAAWWDETAGRHRLAVGYVGEDGIKADTWYAAEGGRLVESTGGDR